MTWINSKYILSGLPDVVVNGIKTVAPICAMFHNSFTISVETAILIMTVQQFKYAVHGLYLIYELLVTKCRQLLINILWFSNWSKGVGMKTNVFLFWNLLEAINIEHSQEYVCYSKFILDLFPSKLFFKSKLSGLHMNIFIISIKLFWFFRIAIKGTEGNSLMHAVILNFAGNLII